LAVIVDEETEDLREAVESLPFESTIIEFKTFERDNVGLNVHAHLFEPVSLTPTSPPSTEPIGWQEMLEWTSENTRELAKTIISRIKTELKDVKHKPLGKYYAFYREKESSKTIFAVLMLRKNSIAIRIGVDPKTFRDEKELVEEKVYKGWFFKYGGRRALRFKSTKSFKADF
jgi:hypothetical protein